MKKAGLYTTIILVIVTVLAIIAIIGLSFYLSNTGIALSDCNNLKERCNEDCGFSFTPSSSCVSNQECNKDQLTKCCVSRRQNCQSVICSSC